LGNENLKKNVQIKGQILLKGEMVKKKMGLGHLQKHLAIKAHLHESFLT
jgi:hypothetical protein